MYTPSMIAAASVAAALHGLDWTRKSGYGLAGLLDELNRITAIEQVSGVRIGIITEACRKVCRVHEKESCCSLVSSPPSRFIREPRTHQQP